MPQYPENYGKLILSDSFVGVVILRYVDPALILTIWAFCCSLFCLLVTQLTGVSGVVCLYFLFFFESICYPVRFAISSHKEPLTTALQCIFTLATKNLGRHTKKGSGLIVMGVGGGAWYPPAQGALADATFTRHSYLVPLSGYLVMMLYAA